MAFCQRTVTTCPWSKFVFFKRYSLRYAHSHTHSHLSKHLKDHDTVVVAYARTAIGSFQGGLASIPATQLSGITIKEALRRGEIKPEQVNEVILGNVVGSNLGQAPSTQASYLGGLPFSTPTTSVNKVCSSGMKSIMFAAQSIATGYNSVVVAGGFESMSNVPYYLPKARTGLGYGHGEVIDGLLKDGLWDSWGNFAMGNCGEKCAKDHGFTREDQDNFALESYRRAQEAQAKGWTANEIVPVTVKSKKGEHIFEKDEEPGKLMRDKVSTVRPAFIKDGTITAVNASKLNDAAATVILTSAKWARENGKTPLAVIRGFADAQQEPIDFPTAPSLAIPKAISNAGISSKDVDLYEINEAFSVVVLANQKLLKLDANRINIWGGGVSLGHPIGVSGARIVLTLINQLHKLDKRFGVASICNGGGGASAIVIERI